MDDAYVDDATLSELLEGLVEMPPTPPVRFGDFVRLRMVDFFRLLTWFSRELVLVRKKLATRCGIFLFL